MQFSGYSLVSLQLHLLSGWLYACLLVGENLWRSAPACALCSVCLVCASQGIVFYSPRYSDDRFTYRHVLLSAGVKSAAEEIASATKSEETKPRNMESR